MFFKMRYYLTPAFSGWDLVQQRLAISGADSLTGSIVLLLDFVVL